MFALYAVCALTSRRPDIGKFVTAGAIPALVELSKMCIDGAPLDAAQRRRPTIA